MRNEIEAGRAAMPDRDAEISQEAARAMLAALREAFKPKGIVSAWPDQGWPDDEDDDADLEDEDWIVGIAYRRPFDASSSYAAEPLNEPGAWTELARVNGATKAKALAALFNTLAEGRAS